MVGSAGSKRVKRLLMIALMVIAVVAGIVVLTIALTWAGQERIAYQPPRPPFPDPGETRRVEFRADDGQRLFAYVIAPPAPRPADGALIAFHGNADLAVRQIPWAHEVARRTGRLIVLAEYRGYGGLDGSPTYTGVRRDARAVYHHVTGELGIDPSRVALFGHSLGSAVAVELASSIERPPQVLILESPFTSARDMARIVLSKPMEYAWQAIARIHYDTRRRVSELDTPVWVVHGTRDMIVPHRMGVQVFESARAPGERMSVQGAGHNDVALRGGERYWQFLERALSAGGEGQSRALGA